MEELSRSGWRPPCRQEEEEQQIEVDHEAVFRVVDVNNSGYVTKTVNTILRSLNKILKLCFQEIKLAAKYLGRRYGINNVSKNIFPFYLLLEFELLCRLKVIFLTLYWRSVVSKI